MFERKTWNSVYCWIYQASCCSQQMLSRIGSESKENLSKFGQKNEQKQLWILTLFSEAAEAVWGQKSLDWLIRHKFPLLKTTPSLIKRPIIQNPCHTSSSKHQWVNYLPQWWVKFDNELSWLFTKKFRGFYLICRK